MTDDEAFARQFRYEEGRLVFRHRERGAPISVLEQEAEALRRAHDARRAAGNRAIGYLMLVSILTILTGIYYAGSPMLAWLPYPYFLEPIIAIVGLGVGMFVVDRWCYDVTRSLRRRPPIGTELGRSGALARRMEDLPWSAHGQSWVMIAIITPLGLVSADLASWNGIMMIATLSAVTLAGAWATLVKFLHWRERPKNSQLERRRRL